MKPDRETLLGLAERCEKAEGPDAALEDDLLIETGFARGRVTASLDAAVAFVGEMLPGWRPGVLKAVNGLWEGWLHGPQGEWEETEDGSTPALALMAAALRAIAEQGGE